MSKFDRRQFLGLGLGASALGLFAAPAIAQAKARVVVIGGGPAGATVARYLAKDAGDKIAVTLIEPKDSFITCFHSNLMVGGYKKAEEITFSYAKLVAGGVTHAKTFAQIIDRDSKVVLCGDGSVIPYDRLVVTPGIDIKYGSVPGYSMQAAQIMPHAWKAGPQTHLLIKQLAAVADGGTIVMVAPPNPYRCPPGPYERVSMMAHVLKATNRGKCKIVILDPKKTYSKQALFEEAWQKYYPGMVEWQDPDMHGGIKNVDTRAMTVTTGMETIKCAMANIIPAQTAGMVAVNAGLANATGFCPINPDNMKSAADANIHVLGDACIAGDMPKSAFSANSQAKVVINVIRGELAGGRIFPAKYTNTCWSLLETDDTVKVGGAYEPKDGKITASSTFVSKAGEDAALRKQTSEENIGWYKGITADIFG